MSRFWGPHSRFASLIVVAVFILDQASKAGVLFGLDLLGREQIHLLPFFDFVMVWNRGISYGLFEQSDETGRWLLTIFMLVAAALLWLWAARAGTRLLALSLALIIGGALGNALDRIIYGAVADFARLFWGEASWYVFNLADAAIVAGVALLLYDSLFGDHGKTRNR
ncbi:MAG: signal peptidase II [Rhodobiaceae bacterium]|nr:signal peptidase II [Rhodobiaceae bacterium]MCC0013493.1 signal peptidase II [Rhodobiaceae bacterium]MCC0018106.1 signal peptidase II [Rhodobiaceae bacterium]MCC0050592.1 signal peptidase II [Rhodobiaceae bacterium]MCC0059795.1 signal peptidase II [Rhodobiaceae bacterium]